MARPIRPDELDHLVGTAGRIPFAEAVSVEEAVLDTKDHAGVGTEGALDHLPVSVESLATLDTLDQAVDVGRDRSCGNADDHEVGMAGEVAEADRV